MALLTDLQEALGNPAQSFILDNATRSGEDWHSADAGQVFLPAIGPASLGDARFREEYGVSYNLVAGAMANGIASVRLVEAMAGAGMLGFFGAAGLLPAAVEEAIRELKSRCAGRPFGCNLIHSPAEPDTEREVAEILIREGVNVVEASAFLTLTLPIVRYRTAGIFTDATGQVVAPNRVMAKVSRVEVAREFLSPPPAKFLQELVESGDLTPEQARMAETIPMACDITAEADSGGHTDNRPAMTLIPTLISLRDELQREHGFGEPVRIGAAGGLATPATVACAFSMGAAYVVTGSVNQATVEAGTSDLVRRLLAEAGQADFVMAPSADMFEMGVKVQVLKRGTMFAMRAARLYEWYQRYRDLTELPAADRATLEKKYFRCSLEEEWQNTVAFFRQRDPAQISRAEKNPRHKMALLFRSYLGRASAWANSGDAGRQIDFQIWCGPAMGAFNQWVRGSFLEDPDQRRVVAVSLNLIYGAARVTRVNILRSQGVRVDPDLADFRPRPEDELLQLMGEKRVLN